MIKLNELSKKIKGESKFALFLHIHPDGDAVGSSLALMLALKKIGIEADVFCEDKIPEKFSYLKGVNVIQNALNCTYPAFMALDSGDLNRLGKFSVEFENHKNTYSIDHHISNTYYAKTNYVCDLPSNSENVYNLINELQIEIDSDIANCLATGIITDTGNLKHKGVKSETIRILANLVELGADLNLINYKTFNEQTKERANLFGITMSKIKYESGGKVAIISVTKENLKISGAKEEETEGFIDFIMGIKGVTVGACLLEKDASKYKISLRGKGVNVNEIAGVFGGGGHILASGCQINGDYYEVLDKLTYAIKSHLPE